MSYVIIKCIRIKTIHSPTTTTTATIYSTTAITTTIATICLPTTTTITITTTITLETLYSEIQMRVLTSNTFYIFSISSRICRKTKKSIKPNLFSKISTRALCRTFRNVCLHNSLKVISFFIRRSWNDVLKYKGIIKLYCQNY